MKPLTRIAAGLLFCLLALYPLTAFAFGWPNSNDSIFPPLPAARSAINFDGRGFIIHGKRTFIVAGELQYPRTPRAQWRDRLLRIKRAGYNTVQTYVFWNYHEPTEGRFEFSGEKDLNAYLQLIHSLGLYAVVRMGPYVNAEWDTGGLPVWLRFKPGLRPMSDNPQFYQAVSPYFSKLIPILAANQISHGGPIVMIQMENEHAMGGGGGGGTDLPNPYYKWYYTKMRTLGVQIPIFFSGLNHNDYPAGDGPFDTSQRTSPWYSTEFWTGWVGRYGFDPGRANQLQRATWQVLAYGGAGYTHYTMAGGTDFDTWNNNEQAASYDFGSPIGQAGDLRPSYYFCKRAALFATSFSDLLADSAAKDGGDGAAPTNGALRVTSRKGPAGELLFLDNRTGNPISTQVKFNRGIYPAAGPITLATGEIVPILRDYSLAPGINLSLAAARLLGIARAGRLTTLVVYGTPGEPVELHFAAAHALGVGEAPGLAVSPAGAVLQTTVPDAAPRVSLFRSGGQTIRVLTMRTEQADRTWFLEGGSLIAVGPDYVGGVEHLSNGTLRLETERNGLDAHPAHLLPCLLYLPGPQPPLTLMSVSVPSTIIADAAPPALGAWQADTTLPITQPDYTDSAWKASAEPLPMGADGDYGAYAWYRATASVPTAGTYHLTLSDAGDLVSCFVNSRHQTSSDVAVRYEHPLTRQLTISLRAGTNQLAFLTAHYGRNKLFNYYGPMDTIDAKGISGPVTLTKGAGAAQEINSFRWQSDDQAPADAAKQAAPDLETSGGNWSEASASTDVFQGRVGWAWFRASLPDLPGLHHRLLFGSIDDNGIVYLNGKQIAADVGINSEATVVLDAAWKPGEPNVLAVAVQNTGGGGGLLGGVRLEAESEDGQDIQGWKMRGGMPPPAFTSSNWKPLSDVNSAGIPTFYHSLFTTAPPGLTGPHPILRASPTGLSRGFMWLNGRCLGRYPEKSPVDGLYLPESLLRPGRNDLVIFDEDGNSPAGVKIIVEEVASRTGSVLQAVPLTRPH